jgi:hypothetical protein
MMPPPNTATDSGRSSHSKTSSLVASRSPAAPRNDGYVGREPVAMTIRAALDDHVFADPETVVALEAGVAAQAVLRGKILDHLEHRAGEVVAQAAQPRHHRLAIDARRAAGVDPKHRRFAHRVRRLRRGDQQLARHAADPGAGGAARPALEQDQSLGVVARPAIGREPRGPGPDDRDVDLALGHGALPCSDLWCPATPADDSDHASDPPARRARL